MSNRSGWLRHQKKTDRDVVGCKRHAGGAAGVCVAAPPEQTPNNDMEEGKGTAILAKGTECDDPGRDTWRRVTPDIINLSAKSIQKNNRRKEFYSPTIQTKPNFILKRGIARLLSCHRRVHK